jgi:hypothetical protein
MVGMICLPKINNLVQCINGFPAALSAPEEEDSRTPLLRQVCFIPVEIILPVAHENGETHRLAAIETRDAPEFGLTHCSLHEELLLAVKTYGRMAAGYMTAKSLSSMRTFKTIAQLSSCPANP